MKSTEQILADMVLKERMAISREPPVEDIYLELSLWRALYKLSRKFPSMKAADMADKANAVRWARIAAAREHIDWAIEQCKLAGKKSNQKNIESALSKLNDAKIFSYETDLAKMSIVKSNTIKEYLKDIKLEES